MEEDRCKVCQGPTEKKYNYYGAENVCASCRNFFRRSVQSGHHPSFKCRLVLNEQGEAKGCVIDSKTRKSCKNCRFKKCQGAGMKINWVGVEAKKSNGTEELKDQCFSSPNDLPHQLQSFPQELSPTFTNEEYNISKLIDSVFQDTTNKIFYTVFQQHPEILHEWIEASRQQRILTYELVKKLEWIDDLILADCAFQLLNLESFSDLQKTELARCNVKNILGLLWSLFSEGPDIIFFTNNLVEYGLTRQFESGVQRVLSILQQAELPRGALIAGYHAIYSTPWAPHAQIEENHFRLTKTINRWSRASPDQMADRLQLALIMMILLLSSEDSSLTLEQKSKIEENQLKYIIMLRRYLKHAYQNEANTKFGGGLMILHYAKELYRMHSLRLPF